MSDETPTPPRLDPYAIADFNDCCEKLGEISPLPSILTGHYKALFNTCRRLRDERAAAIGRAEAAEHNDREIRKHLAQRIDAADRNAAERDALRGLLIEQDPPECRPRRWWAWLPNELAPMGMCRTEFDTEDEAWAALRDAAGISTKPTN